MALQNSKRKEVMEGVVKMNRFAKIIIVGLMLLATLITAGCGEEKKYNELKNQVLPKIEGILNIKTDAGTGDEFTTLLNSKSKSIETHLAEMQRLAASDLKLNNDYLKVKSVYEKNLAMIKQNRKNYESMKQRKVNTREKMNYYTLGF